MLYCPKQSRSPSGELRGVGPGLCGLPGIHLLDTSVNKGQEEEGPEPPALPLA